jgi:uncharacterized protein
MTKRRWFVFVAATAFVLTALDWIAGSVLCAPAPARVGDLPADLHGHALTFPSASGSTIHAWWIQSERSKGVVLLLHGVRANRLAMLGRARFLSRAGYTVLLPDFQAHGESSGQQIGFGYIERLDAVAAVEFIHGALPNQAIAVVGVSLGGAAALLAEPELPVRALVLEEVYPDLISAARNRLRLHFGNVGAALTPLLTWQLRARLGIDPQLLTPLNRIAVTRAAKLIIVAGDDRHTTLEDSNRLFAAARAPKELWVIPGAAHVDLHAHATKEYEDRVLRFLARWFGGDSESG